MGVEPAALTESLKSMGLSVMQPIKGAGIKPSTGWAEKVLLIHGLVGTTSFQASRPISREQEQRLARTIGFYRRGKQIGHSRSGGGDHRDGTACSGCHSERQKPRRSLINRWEDIQLTPCCDQATRHRKGTRSASRAENNPAEPPAHQRLNQRDRSVQIGA